jgi:MFS family permease
VRRHVEEPEVWRRERVLNRPAPFRMLFSAGFGRATLALSLMNACTLFGWWGLNTWVPAYLVLPVDQGGAGLSLLSSSGVVLITQIGMWFGYITFGFVADAIGRKRAYAIFVLAASGLLPLYGFVKSPLVLLALGPFIAFFGTGHYSGFGPLTAAIYPTAIRATAQGFTYNATAAGSAFLLAAVALYWVPEPKREEEAV